MPAASELLPGARGQENRVGRAGAAERKGKASPTLYRKQALTGRMERKRKGEGSLGILSLLKEKVYETVLAPPPSQPYFL